MPLRHVSLIVVVLAVLALGAAPPSIADDAATGPGANVQLTVRLGKLVDGARAEVKSYRLVIVGGGVGSKLLSGARVPFPSGPGDDGGVVYQNVGFTTEAHAWVLDDGRIKIIATIEDSRIVADPPGSAATVETRQLSVSAIVSPGTPLEVTRVEGIRDQSGFVEIEASVLR